MAESTFGVKVEGRAEPLFTRPGPAAAIYSLAMVAVILLLFLPGAGDYVGSDNDDVMRLVEVRDLLSGQNWFDLTQYRLGLAGGTPMHWSRLIDLPIALLITFFSPFLAPEQAEAAAVILWPMILVPFLLLPLATAARRIGDVPAMHVALGLGCLFIWTCIRFRPGSIDHHNVQLVLMMWIAAMLGNKATSSYAVAGIASALAIAIGAETAPLVAVACLCVVLQWIWHGRSFAGAAQAFGLSLTLSVSAAYFLTVPPHSYAVVTCDSLSLGFYALSALGGTGLLLIARLGSRLRATARLALAFLLGGVLLMAARAIAPECLGNPLGNLDPMLVRLWLDGVSEARSILAVAASEPESIGGFYAVGLFGLAVCLFRMLQGRDVEVHLSLFLLIGAAWAIALIQVRGAFFANLLAILPLSILISDLRRRSSSSPGNVRLGVVYVATVLASVPAMWAFSGIVWDRGFGSVTANLLSTADAAEEGECASPDDMAALAGFETGVVAAPSNSGADILRFTRHRVLSAPYHRNQGGMLTELHIGLAPPSEAKAFLKGAGVTILAFCRTDPQTAALMKIKKDGLYASLGRGEIPAYLQPVGKAGTDGFQFYRVLADRL